MVLFALFWLGVFVLPMVRLKRAILQVIRIFRREGSLCFQRSKTVGELGLGPPPLWDSIFKMRDFRPFAVQVLIKAGVIHLDPEGRMCMRENKAAEFLAVNGMEP
jgi:hypothetical protein